MTDSRTVLVGILDDLRSGWKPLAATDVVYKVVALVLLTPLVGVLFHAVLALSGNSVLADQDILFFFLGPVGWICSILIGGLWLAIIALEQAALLAVLGAIRSGRRMHIVTALRCARTSAWVVLQVAARMIAWTLLAVAPFLILAWVTYRSLLSEYDINYYLQTRPPEFLAALIVGGVLITGMSLLLLWMCSGWFFALPLVLFEGVQPSAALRTSNERTRGHRRTIVFWIVGWMATSAIVSGIATSAVVGLGNLFVPHATGSLELLAAAVGVALLLSAGVNLAVNLLSTTSFAAMLFHLYSQLACGGMMDLSALDDGQAGQAEPRFQLTRLRLIAACVVGVVAAVAVGAATMHSVRLDDSVQVIAHRGASKAAPENTLAAVNQAIEDGTDWIEIDVQETADGEVVVMHDSDFMKLSGLDLKIWDATMADLEDIDIGSWFAPEFKDERVPTLGQVLDQCKGKAKVVIELKYYGHDQQLEQRVAETVELHDMVADVEIMSLKVDAVQKMKALRPTWKVGLLMSVSAGNLKSSGADFLAVNAGFADRGFISSAHKQQKEVYVWTVNDAPSMSVMIGRGVDGLITDKPALAKSVLAQRAGMSPFERLLIELAEILGVAPEIGEA